jgi:branched-chain amino acid transport system substrate-binding protein
MINQTRTIIAALVVVLLVILGVNFFGNDRNDEQTIKIGSIAGITGEYAEVGENWTNGIKLAHEQHQASNSQLRVEIVQEDSGFDTQTGVTAYKRLTNIESIDALINLGTPTMDGIYRLVKDAPYPVVHGFEQSAEAQDDSVVQLSPSNDPAERALGEYAIEQVHKEVVVLYNDSTTYVNFLEAFKEGFSGSVNQVALSPDEQNDFRTQVTKALTNNPDAIVFITTPQQAASVTNQLMDQGATELPLLHDANLHTGFTDYKRLVGDNFSKLSDDVFTIIKSPTKQAFVDDYKKRFGEKPGVAADMGYDAFNLLVKTYSSDSKEWLENVKSADFSGASGQASFNDVGMRAANFEIVTLGDDLKL